MKLSKWQRGKGWKGDHMLMLTVKILMLILLLYSLCGNWIGPFIWWVQVSLGASIKPILDTYYNTAYNLRVILIFPSLYCLKTAPCPFYLSIASSNTITRGGEMRSYFPFIIWPWVLFPLRDCIGCCIIACPFGPSVHTYSSEWVSYPLQYVFHIHPHGPWKNPLSIWSIYIYIYFFSTLTLSMPTLLLAKESVTQGERET